MLKRSITLALIAAAIAVPVSLSAGTVEAQEYYGRGWQDNRGWGGPPPEWGHYHRHHDYGGVIAGGIAAGLIGGLISNAIQDNGQRNYAPPPPPEPECWYQRQTVQDRYDDGYHLERVRVCN